MIGMIAKPYANPAILDNSGWTTVFPASNVLNNDLGRVAKTGALGNGQTCVVTVDLGAAKLVDCLGALWHNGRASDTLNIAASNSSTFSSYAYSTPGSGAVALRTGATKRDVLNLWKMLTTLDTPVMARYWRFTFTMGAAITSFQVSRLFVGKMATFAIGAQKASLGATDLNTTVTSEVGEIRTQEDPQLIRPVVSLEFQYAKQSEMEEVLGGYTLALGTSKPMLVCTDLTSANLQDNLAFGRPERVLVHDSEFYDVWTFEAVVASIGP